MQGVERLLLRPEEAAAALGLSRSRVYELIAAGQVPSVTVGKSRRVPAAAHREWVDRLGDRSAAVAAVERATDPALCEVS